MDIADQIASMQPELIKAALHWTDGRRADAEDLAQDTMLRALRYKHRFSVLHPDNPRRDLKAWLLTIMRHTFYDQGQKKMPVQSLDEMLAQSEGMDMDSGGGSMTVAGTLASKDDTEATALASATIDETMDAIEGDMPPYYEKVVRLVFIEGMTYQEAATELRIPLGTAMSAVFRTRRRLGLREPKTEDAASAA